MGTNPTFFPSSHLGGGSSHDFCWSLVGTGWGSHVNNSRFYKMVWLAPPSYALAYNPSNYS